MLLEFIAIEKVAVALVLGATPVAASVGESLLTVEIILEGASD